MFASQLIYTACGKDKSGAFSVWSKSADITKEESDEIAKMMLYKRHSDDSLPYEPNEEQLRTLYPKKFGFFQLTSSRFCIAQSTYLGRVYSDFDERQGNYIIHAFVAESFAGILPMAMTDSTLFRTALSYEEWHENDAPESLPQIEIPEQNVFLTDSQIHEFFDETRKKQFPYLLQAAMYSVSSGETVVFYDSDENLKCWYKALGMCIPRGMQKNLPFSSFFTEPPMHPAPNAKIEMKLRNILPKYKNRVSDFNYEQAVQGGKYAFDFCNGTVNDQIAVSRYVSEIVSKLTDSAADALYTAEAIDGLMASLDCSFDEAANLHHLRIGAFGWFTDLAEIVETVEKMKSLLPGDAKGIADDLYDAYVAVESDTYGDDLLAICRFVFENSEKADKGLIVGKYLAHLRDFGVNTDADYAEYASAVRGKAPFAWTNFVAYLFEKDHFKAYVDQNIRSFSAMYLLYTSLIEHRKELDETQKSTAHTLYLRLMTNAIRSESKKELDALLDGIRVCGEKWEIWIIKNSLVTLAGEGGKVTEACSRGFLLSLVEMLSNGELAMIILKQLVDENGDEDRFISEYISASDSQREKFLQYERVLCGDPKCKAFLNRVDIERFRLKKNVTMQELKSFCGKFADDEKAMAILCKKATVYLSRLQGEELIDEGLAVYADLLEKLPADAPAVLDAVSETARLLFDIDLKILIASCAKLGSEGMKRFRPMLGHLLKYERPIPDRYFVLGLGMDTRAIAEGKPGRKGSTKQDVLKMLTEKEYYSALPNFTSIDRYIEHFLPDVLGMYLALSAECDIETLFSACFEPLANSGRFEACFVQALEGKDKKEAEKLLVDWFSFACGTQNAFSDRIRRMLTNYLDNLSRRDRKKLFATVEERVDKSCSKGVKSYIDRYLKENESFLDKVFGGFGKGKDKEQVEVKGEKKEKPKGKQAAPADFTADAKSKKQWKK